MEKNEERRVRAPDAGQSVFLPPRGCGGGTPALLRQRGPWDLQEANGSGHLGQQLGVVADPCKSAEPPVSSLGLSCVTRRATLCFAARRFLPDPSARQPGLPWVLAEETATQCGPDWAGRGGGAEQDEVAGGGSGAS